jgi:hypothetical protein
VVSIPQDCKPIWILGVLSFAIPVLLVFAALMGAPPAAFTVLMLLLIALLAMVWGRSTRKYGIQVCDVRVIAALVGLVWSSCLISLAIAPLSDSLFVPWHEIPPLSYWRGISAVLLASFFPGFGIAVWLRTIRKLGTGFLVIVSFILSQFLSGMLTLLSTILEGGMALANVSLIIANVVALIVFCVWLLNGSSKTVRLSFSTQEFLTLLIVTVATVGSILVVNFSENSLIPSIDQWYHFGYALRVIDASPLVYTQSYYWPQLYYAQVLTLSGMPYCNAYLLLVFQPLLHVFAFFIMAKRVSNAQTAAWSTVAYALFMGFGGVLVVILQSVLGFGVNDAIIMAGIQTGDIVFNTYSWFFYILPKSFGLIVLFLCFTLLAFSKESDFDVRTGLVLGFLLACGYIWHVSEALYFFLLAPLLASFLFTDVKQRYSLAVGVVTAILIMVGHGLFDSMQRVSVLGSDASASSAFSMLQYAILAACCCIAICTYHLWAPKKLKRTVEGTSRILSRTFGQSKHNLATMLVVVYSVLLLAWFVQADVINVTRYGSIVPLFLFPAKFGLVIPLAILSVLLKDEKKIGFMFAAVLGILTLVISKVFVILFLSTSLHLMTEARRLEWLWPWFSMLAGITLAKTSESFRTHKAFNGHVMKNVVRLGIVLLLVVSIWSKPSEVYWHSNNTHAIDISDLQGLEAFGAIEANVSVISPGSGFRTIRSFTKMPIINLWNDIIFDTAYAHTAYDLLSHNRMADAGYPLGYLYVLESQYQPDAYYDKGYIMSHLSHFVGQQYNDSRSAIYSLPRAAGPSKNASTLLLIDQKELNLADSYGFLVDLAAIGYISYEIRCMNDLQIKSSTRTIITANSSIISNDVIMSWVQAGGVVCILDVGKNMTHSSYTEADAMGSSIARVSLPNLMVPENLSYSLPGAEVSWYESNMTRIYPLSSHLAIGSGMVYYVELWPYLEQLSALNLTEKGRNAFSIVGEVLKLALPDAELGVPCSSRHRAAVFNGIKANGFISMKPSGVLITENLSLEEIVISSSIYSEDRIMGSLELTGLSLLGDYQIEIAGNNMTLGSETTGVYTMLESYSSLNISIQAGNMGVVVLQLRNESTSDSIRIEGGSVMIRTSQHNACSQLLVLNPSMEINGTTTFLRMIVDKYDFYADGVQSESNGLTRFDVVSSGKIILISDFTVEGQFKAERYAPIDSVHNIIGIWNSAIQNPVYLSSVLLVMSIALAAGLKKRKHGNHIGEKRTLPIRTDT